MSLSSSVRASLPDDLEKGNFPVSINPVDLKDNASTNARALPAITPGIDAEMEKGLNIEESKSPLANNGSPGGTQNAGGGRGGLPPSHPMHPSQFSGDKFERTALWTLLGSFCVMFCSFGWINCE